MLLSAVRLGAPPVEGFGADVAAVIPGGADVWLDELEHEAGLRGVTEDAGAPSDLYWLPAAAVFGEGVRAGGASAAPTAPLDGVGLELHLPWSALYRDLGGAVPPGATVAVAAVLVNGAGDYLSNQALPPYTTPPDAGRGALSAVVVAPVDSDGDGVGDGVASPWLAP